MRFSAFLCLFTLLAASAVAFPIKTRDEQHPHDGAVPKTTLYNMIFKRAEVQKPSHKASGLPVHVHKGMHAHPQKKPAHYNLHVHRREPAQQPQHAPEHKPVHETKK